MKAISTGGHGPISANLRQNAFGLPGTVFGSGGFRLTNSGAKTFAFAKATRKGLEPARYL